MLHYAAHANDEDGVRPDDARTDTDLRRYVEHWGRCGDLGVVAHINKVNSGAAWVRLFPEGYRDDPAYVDDQTPELAIAVLPGFEGQGIGTRMLTSLVDVARTQFPAIVLTVRTGNPAIRLYKRVGFHTVGSITNRVGTESIKMVLMFE
ncbi:MAG: GNAT family N-acetyltransferase [Proteobacteria bacterium]|nr:GNAT family N-acetyltransferase [Pseudomonadota bacterium]